MNYSKQLENGFYRLKQRLVTPGREEPFYVYFIAHSDGTALIPKTPYFYSEEYLNKAVHDWNSALDSSVVPLEIE